MWLKTMYFSIYVPIHLSGWNDVMVSIYLSLFVCTFAFLGGKATPMSVHSLSLEKTSFDRWRITSVQPDAVYLHINPGVRRRLAVVTRKHGQDPASGIQGLHALTMQG
jgi:hypothetical protein